jgi:hypothetical protein
MENIAGFFYFGVFPAFALLLIAAVGLLLYNFGQDKKTINLGLVLVVVPLGICTLAYCVLAVIPAWFR